jgi:hypothetical protein
MDAKGSVGQLAYQWTFVWSAPALGLGLMAVVAGAVWWLRGTFGKSKVIGLRAQISAAQEIGKKLEQHLSIARKQEQASVAIRQQLEAQIAELQREVLFSPEKIRARVKVLANTVAELETVQKALTNTFSHASTEEGRSQEID